MNNDFKITGVNFDCPQCKKVADDEKKIPVKRIIEKLDSFFKTNDLSGAKNLLEYWQEEAKNKGDLSGELSVVNEWLGLSRKTSNKQKGENAINRAIELVEDLGIGDTVSGATVILNAATTCKAFSLLEKAMPLYKNAQKVYMEKLSQNDLRLAAFYNNYATALTDVGDYILAEQLYKKAIAITSKQKSSLLDCAVSYVNLAHLYEEKENSLSERIEECLKKAEAILEDEQIERDSYYAFVCEKCAPSFDYFGYFMFAKELYEKSREIYERS